MERLLLLLGADERDELLFGALERDELAFELLGLLALLGLDLELELRPLLCGFGLLGFFVLEELLLPLELLLGRALRSTLSLEGRVPLEVLSLLEEGVEVRCWSGFQFGSTALALLLVFFVAFPVALRSADCTDCCALLSVRSCTGFQLLFTCLPVLRAVG